MTLKVGDVVKVKSINKSETHVKNRIGVIIEIKFAQNISAFGPNILISLESGIEWHFPSALEFVM